jgi:hypothetical protein
LALLFLENSLPPLQLVKTNAAITNQLNFILVMCLPERFDMNGRAKLTDSYKSYSKKIWSQMISVKVLIKDCI